MSRLLTTKNIALFFVMTCPIVGFLTHAIILSYTPFILFILILTASNSKMGWFSRVCRIITWNLWVKRELISKASQTKGLVTYPFILWLQFEAKEDYYKTPHDQFLTKVCSAKLLEIADGLAKSIFENAVSRSVKDPAQAPISSSPTNSN